MTEKKTSGRRMSRWTMLAIAASFMGVVILALVIAKERWPSWLHPRYDVTVAAGRAESSGGKLVSLLAREWSKEHSFVRLAPLSTEGAEENASRLAEGSAHAAIVRGDHPRAAEWRTLFTLQTIGVAVVLPPRSGIESGAALAGRKLGLVAPASASDPMLKLLFARFGIAEKDLSIMEARQAGAAMKAGRIQALVLLIPLTTQSRPLADAVNGVNRAFRAKATLLSLDEAEEIARSAPVYASYDVTPAALGVDVADRAEEISTLSLGVHLLARPSLPERLAAEIARSLVALRQRLLTSEPLIAQIEPPDIEATAGIPAHPGVRKFLNSELASLADEAVSLYWILGVVAALATPVFAFVGRWYRGEEKEPFERRALELKLLAAGDADAAALDRALAGRLTGYLDDLQQGRIEAEEFLCLDAIVRHLRSRT
jgi:TRAP-type uncharacterized transport system substrate-binding protein